MSRVPSLEMTLPRYLKSSTVFSSFPSMQIELEHAVELRGRLQQDLSLGKTDGEAKKLKGLSKFVDDKLEVRPLV